MAETRFFWGGPFDVVSWVVWSAHVDESCSFAINETPQASINEGGKLQKYIRMLGDYVKLCRDGIKIDIKSHLSHQTRSLVRKEYERTCTELETRRRIASHFLGSNT